VTPSFRFGLERVKSLREQAEDSAREELARELALRMRGEAILRRAAAAAAAARDTGRESAVRSASGADLLAAQQWMEVADRRRREAALDLDRQNAEVDARRAALVEASRQREVIARLEARRRDEHRREVERRAQIDLDEVALTVHRRRGVAA
jgi:flagellar export protein FliJ